MNGSHILFLNNKPIPKVFAKKIVDGFLGIYPQKTDNEKSGKWWQTQ
ncbi:hypothetical protein BLA3211_06138 [Burkholderia aenigmatica]|uniref:Uncharacterized protein n=1 Tax=Burkholderia aenigmatica TaxID=2015348 RepID=A0A6J5JHN8_9BURK|nr:hypothetical protein BLA3211_06138 [Burkholderia aenigmatica]